MVRVEIDDAVVLGYLARLRAVAQDMTPALKAIGADLVSNIQQNLGKGITPWGAAMTPLKYRKGVPLNDTRQHIYQRITYRMLGNSAVEVGMLESETEKIGRLHQYGGTVMFNGRPVRIPARPFMPIRNGQVDLPTAWRDEIVDRLHQHIEKAAR